MRPRRIPEFSFTVALIWALCASLGVHAAEPTRVALLVGVNKYLKPGLPNLSYAEADVQAVSAQLATNGFKTTLLLGSAAGDKQAGREQILAAARKMVENLGKDDLALVMLSGHGQQFKVKAKDGEEKDDGFFIPVEGVKNDPRTLVSLSELIDDILAPNVGRKLVVVDACRNTPKDPSRGAKGIQGRTITLPEDTAVLFSCRAGQESFENDELKHGLFTHCLLEGLSGHAAARNGTVYWDRLVAHVTEQMGSDEIRQRMPEDRAQEPIPAGGVGRLALAHVNLPASRPSADPAPRPAGTPAPGKSAGGIGSQFDFGGLPSPLQQSIAFAGKKTGDERHDNELGMSFGWCPPGTFTMGSPKSDQARDVKSEGQVSVELRRGFWLGRYEVRRDEWQMLMGTAPWTGQEKIKEGPEYPATNVTWDMAHAFCKRLTDTERAAGRLPNGWKYDLPTEAQWEYACRAGSQKRFTFGDDFATLAKYGWYDANAMNQSEDYAHPVGRKAANAWGFLDMHGNVSEWCADAYKEKLPGGADPLVSPPPRVTSAQTPEQFAKAMTQSDPFVERVVRGGMWMMHPAGCRSCARSAHKPVTSTWAIGFRVVCSE